MFTLRGTLLQTFEVEHIPQIESFVVASTASMEFKDIVIDPNDPGEIRVANIRRSNGLLRRLRNLETWMDRKMNFEAMGVERVPQDKRRPPQILNVSQASASHN